MIKAKHFYIDETEKVIAKLILLNEKLDNFREELKKIDNSVVAIKKKIALQQEPADMSFEHIFTGVPVDEKELQEELSRLKEQRENISEEIKKVKQDLEKTIAKAESILERYRKEVKKAKYNINFLERDGFREEHSVAREVWLDYCSFFDRLAKQLERALLSQSSVDSEIGDSDNASSLLYSKSKISFDSPFFTSRSPFGFPYRPPLSVSKANLMPAISLHNKPSILGSLENVVLRHIGGKISSVDLGVMRRMDPGTLFSSIPPGPISLSSEARIRNLAYEALYTPTGSSLVSITPPMGNSISAMSGAYHKPLFPSGSLGLARINQMDRMYVPPAGSVGINRGYGY